MAHGLAWWKTVAGFEHARISRETVITPSSSLGDPGLSLRGEIIVEWRTIILVEWHSQSSESLNVRAQPRWRLLAASVAGDEGVTADLKVCVTG